MAANDITVLQEQSNGSLKETVVPLVGRNLLTATTQELGRAAIGAASTSDTGVIVQLTQANYNALSAPVPTTLYVIIG
jgi:hypothetical protein